MTTSYDLVVIGAGSAGLTAVDFASRLGLRVALVERDRIGGDCLWTGCVPSKSLLAAAKVAHQTRTADRFGIAAVEPRVDLRAVWQRVRGVREGIATEEDDADVLAAKGVEVVTGSARLVEPRVVQVGERTLSTRFVLVATGSRPAVPPVEGLAESGFLTSDDLWDREAPPRRVAVLGGGSVAVELGQALARLGVEVSMLELAPRMLSREEPELADRLLTCLEADGVRVHTDARTRAARVEGDTKVLDVALAGEVRHVAADEIVVATGRRPNVEDLGLDDLGVEIGPRGVEVDDRLRTSVDGVFAAGDVAGRYRFTHSGAYEAALAVRNMFFPLSRRADAVVPWATFTDPELGHVGLTEAEARERLRRVEVHVDELARSDRARADDATTGAIKVVTSRGRVVGAHVLAPGAGEVINELSLAIARGLRLDQLAEVVHVYPTISFGLFRLAGDAALARARRRTRFLPGVPR